MHPKRRPNLRLPEFDYSSPGIYYVTIVQQDRLPLFGSVTASGVSLNPAGRMIEEVWQSFPERFPWVSLDSFILMPDHIHALLVFGGDPGVQESVQLGSVIGWFKSLTTRKYGDGVVNLGWPRYNQRLWLMNYYERVVRNDAEVERFRNYIQGNPYRWMEKRQA